VDLDDKVVHYLLLFGGMVIAEGVHRLADAIGTDFVKWIKRLVRGRHAKK
jgi:hypothetical protein